MTDLVDARRASFKSVGDEYERARPQYPLEAVQWIAGEPGLAIDLGCGPGKLTTQLAQLGYETIGIDPSLKMLHGVQSKPIAAVCAKAEEIPLRSAAADLVTAAQAFHWFDYERAIPEMRRILKPGGRVGLLWNLRDESVDWVRSLSRIIGSEDAMSHTLGPTDDFERDVVRKLRHGGAFEAVDSKRFRHEQKLTEQGLVDLVRSRSYVAILDTPARDEIISSVRQLCREHPQLKGQESFGLPYITRAFRARAERGKSKKS